MPYSPIGPRQRRMWVLPAPKGRFDKSDRYEIGIFYALRFFYYDLVQPLVVMFTSTFQQDVFVSEEPKIFVSEITGDPSRRLYDVSEKKPQVFKSLWEKNIFVSERKQRKDI